MWIKCLFIIRWEFIILLFHPQFLLPNVPVKCALYTFTGLFNCTFAIILCVAFGWVGHTNSMTGGKDFCALTGHEGHTKKAESMYPSFFSQCIILWSIFSCEWYQRYVDPVRMIRLFCRSQIYGHHLHNLSKRCVKKTLINEGCEPSCIHLRTKCEYFQDPAAFTPGKSPIWLISLLVCWPGQCWEK